MPHGLTAVFDGSGVFLNAHYDDHIDHDDEGGHHDDEGGKDDYVPWEPEEWKPFELPQSAKDYLSTNYPEIHFWAEEQEVEGQTQIMSFWTMVLMPSLIPKVISLELSTHGQKSSKPR